MEIKLNSILDQLSEDKINLVVDDSALRAAGGKKWKCGSKSKSSKSRSSSRGGWCKSSKSESWGCAPKYKGC